MLNLALIWLLVRHLSNIVGNLLVLQSVTKSNDLSFDALHSVSVLHTHASSVGNGLVELATYLRINHEYAIYCIRDVYYEQKMKDFGR